VHQVCKKVSERRKTGLNKAHSTTHYKTSTFHTKEKLIITLCTFLSHNAAVTSEAVKQTRTDNTDKNIKLLLWTVLPSLTVTLSHTELFMTANFQVLCGLGRRHLRLTRTPVESATPTQVWIWIWVTVYLQLLINRLHYNNNTIIDSVAGHSRSCLSQSCQSANVCQTDGQVIKMHPSIITREHFKHRLEGWLFAYDRHWLFTASLFVTV